MRVAQVAGAARAEAWRLVGLGLEEGVLCWGPGVRVPGFRVGAAPGGEDTREDLSYRASEELGFYQN